MVLEIKLLPGSGSVFRDTAKYKLIVHFMRYLFIWIQFLYQGSRPYVPLLYALKQMYRT